MTRISVVTGDITALDVDAIVNAANSTLLGGGGVDGAIHAAAGPALLEECRRVVAIRGQCAPGDAVITGAGALAARHVIHTVGPIWDGRGDVLDPLLASCYSTALALATANDVGSIAFPNISTGVYGYPKPRAARVAVAAVRTYLDAVSTPVERLLFVCFDQENLALYEDLLGS